MLAIWIVAVLLTGYVIGCAHGSVLAQRLSGVDLKETGVKNAGASNATIVLGKKYGALVALVDIGKGALTIIVLRMLLGNAFSEEVVWTLLFLAGAAVVIGHNFPFYMKFNGGKGTATVIGVLLALDWRIGLAGLALFIAASLLSNYIVVGVLMLYVTLLVVAVWMAEGAWPIVTAAGLFLLALWKHIENFQRIKEGTEKKVRTVIKR
ncbi:glycerol-3-phosphate acyltransferase [Chungangia koreensis]|uniref:Glycerol-3-phosphate acyltransferase n=1 Tax=Chungangia koreensis TaxID=752657 RepID=A0ABV8X5N2_9LACT